MMEISRPGRYRVTLTPTLAERDCWVMVFRAGKKEAHTAKITEVIDGPGMLEGKQLIAATCVLGRQPQLKQGHHLQAEIASISYLGT